MSNVKRASITVTASGPYIVEGITKVVKVTGDSLPLDIQKTSLSVTERTAPINSLKPLNLTSCLNLPELTGTLFRFITIQPCALILGSVREIYQRCSIPRTGLG